MTYGNAGGWGSPNKFKEDYIDQALTAAKIGMTEHEIAQLFSISLGTLQLWKYQHPALGENLKEGKKLWDERIEASLAQRALGYSHTAEQIFLNKDGEIVRAEYTKHYPPETAAAGLWLANRNKKDWSLSPGKNDTSGEIRVVIVNDPDAASPNNLPKPSSSTEGDL